MIDLLFDPVVGLRSEDPIVSHGAWRLFEAMISANLDVSKLWQCVVQEQDHIMTTVNIVYVVCDLFYRSRSKLSATLLVLAESWFNAPVLAQCLKYWPNNQRILTCAMTAWLKWLKCCWKLRMAPNDIIVFTLDPLLLTQPIATVRYRRTVLLESLWSQNRDQINDNILRLSMDAMNQDLKQMSCLFSRDDLLQFIDSLTKEESRFDQENSFMCERESPLYGRWSWLRRLRIASVRLLIMALIETLDISSILNQFPDALFSLSLNQWFQIMSLDDADLIAWLTSITRLHLAVKETPQNNYSSWIGQFQWHALMQWQHALQHFVSVDTAIEWLMDDARFLDAFLLFLKHVDLSVVDTKLVGWMEALKSRLNSAMRVGAWPFDASPLVRRIELCLFNLSNKISE